MSETQQMRVTMAQVRRARELLPLLAKRHPAVAWTVHAVLRWCIDVGYDVLLGLPPEPGVDDDGKG